ncbi:MAG: hypothetical protein M3Q06_00915 [Bacteroidota bacterium]|nr:hypothetical protein [Bacteroidota bacterium]
MKTTSCFLLLTCLLLAACKKDKSPTTSATGKLSYGDSVFYLKAAAYTISPLTPKTGSYSAFPADLNMDPQTGKITVSLKGKDGTNSQTGLRYRIIFQPANGPSDTTYIVLAGINYQDKIYYLDQNQTTANPVYNASATLSFPGGTFSSSNSKLAIHPATGQIDLQKTVENSLFHNDPKDNDWEVVTINYQTNDAGAGSKNSLDVVLYYYSATDKIPSNISSIMRVHQEQLIGLAPTAIPVTNAPIDNEIDNIVSLSKPRPPCIIIIGR